jgi:hypothetical protein
MNKHSTRNWMALCAIAVFLTIGSRVAVAAVTNVSMVAHFTLSGFKGDQSSAAPFKITNKDILQALNDTGQFNFSSSAEIIFLSFEGELPSIAVRERNGSDVTTTDVSSFFFITEPLEVHHGPHKTSYAIYIYNFDNQNGTSFAAGGMTTLHGGTLTGPGIGALDRDKSLTTAASGSGSVNGDTIVVRGTVNGGSAKAEVD